MLPICGAIFEAARPDDELTRLENKANAPDFWKDQAGAQSIMQRRRRLEQDRDLLQSLKKKSDDLAVLVEWAEAGEALLEAPRPRARTRSQPKSGIGMPFAQRFDLTGASDSRQSRIGKGRAPERALEWCGRT